jgi:hypothetical protein
VLVKDYDGVNETSWIRGMTVVGCKRKCIVSVCKSSMLDDVHL